MPDDRFPKLRALHAVFGLDCPYTDHERGVAAVLILDRDEKRGAAYRGQAGIADRAGMSRRQVQRALASLLERTDGPLEIRAVAQGRNQGAGGRAPNLYRVELRANLTRKGGQVERQPDAQPEGDLCARTEGVVRQNEGGLCASLAQDLSRDRSRDRSSTSARGSAPESAPVFSLASPAAPKQAARRRKKAQRKRTDAEVASHRELLDLFVAGVERRTGARPEIGSREAGAAWKLLDWAKGNAARAASVIREATSREFGGSTSLVSIAADPNKYIGAVPRTAQRGPVQPDYDAGAFDARSFER